MNENQEVMKEKEADYYYEDDFEEFLILKIIGCVLECEVFRADIRPG